MKESKLDVMKGFLGLYIVFFLILTLFTLYNFLPTIFEYITRIFNNEYLKHPIFYGFTSGLYLLFVLFSIYVLYLIFSKRKIAKLFNIIHLWILFLLPVIYDLIDWLIPPNYGLEGIGAILSIIFLLPWAIIWTIYFMRSERVKNTFVK